MPIHHFSMKFPLVLMLFASVPTTALAVDPEICQRWTKTELLRFRDSYVNDFIKSTHPNPDNFFPVVYDFTEERRDWAAFVKNCPKQLEALGMNACFANFSKMMSAHIQSTRPQKWIGPPTDNEGKPNKNKPVLGGYAFEQSDADYLKSQPQEAMKLPKEFESPDPELWKKKAEEKKLPYLEFPSGPAEGGKRILIFEKIGGWDRFLFADPNTEGHLFGMIVAENTKKSSPRIYFREFRPSQDPKDKKVYPVNNVVTCFNCHANGLRRIVPLDGAIFTKPVAGDPEGLTPQALAQHRLDSFNKKIAEYGTPNWQGQLRIWDFGPSFGSTPKANCVRCHNGYDRGELNYALSWGEILRKVRVEGSMPPAKHPLSKKEREALLKDLAEEWKGNLHKWVNATSCH
jgi:hypothetical protein